MLGDVLSGLIRSGLAHGEGLGDVEADSGILSVGGRGDRGTFQRLASSGRSSSPSSSVYSASSSLIDFLLGCHDVLLFAGCCRSVGGSPGRRGDKGLGIGLCSGEVGLGDGDLERLQLLIAVMAREGVEAFRYPRRKRPGLGKLSECVGGRPLVPPNGGDRCAAALVSSRMVVKAAALFR